MGGNYFTNAALFLVQVAFGFYILAVLLRLLLQWARADFYNPLSQFLVKITSPAVVPLRRFIPGVKGIDMASVLLLLLLQSVEIALVGALSPGEAHLNIGGLLVLSVARLLSLLVNVFFFSILIRVILSWVRPNDSNPVSDLLYSITEPLLGRARALLPAMSGLDLSPIVIMVGLQLVTMLVVAPLTDMGVKLMGG